MIITINGSPGSGKSTVAKQLAALLNYDYYAVGQLMRVLAKEKGISLHELSELAKHDARIDTLLDDKLKTFKDKDNIVLDARLGYFFIPNSFKIRLTVELDEAAQRLLKDVKEGKRATEHLQDLEDIKNKVQERITSEQVRYKQYYKTDPSDKTHYDLIIDTTKNSVSELIEQIKQVLP